MKNVVKKIILGIICTFMVSSQVLASASDSDIKFVEKTLINALDTIRNVDLETIKKNYSDYQSEGYIKVITRFFDDYPEALDMTKKTLSEIEYNIKDTRWVDNEIVCTVYFTGPDFKKIIGKVLPKVLAKNIFSLFSRRISEKNICEIIKYIYDEVQNEKKDFAKYKPVSFNYAFRFKKQGDMWVISNFSDIEGALKNIFKIG